MKRSLIILLLAFAFILAACGGGEEATQAPEPTAVEEQQPTEAPAVEEEPEAMEGAELRFTFYADGNEADVMQGLLDEFMAEYPEITVVLDVVPYATIDEQLPVQVETGEGPDLARITNFGAYSGKLLDLRDYLEDPAYYEANFPAPILEAMGYGGFPDGLSVTGPYVNKTLFDQAGIEMPGEGAS